MPRRLAARIAGPLAALGLTAAAWMALKWLGGFQDTVLPGPGQAVAALADGLTSGAYWPHIGSTLGAVAIGYAVGALIALGVAALLAVSATAERFLMVPIIAFQSIPKIALGPLLFIWVGYGMGASVTLVVLACFYPIFVNAFIALRGVDPNLIDLYRACGAGRLRILLAVRFPTAASQIMTGLEVAVVFALLAAVVMEFVSATSGLGFLIQNATTTLDTPTAFAAIILLALSGVLASSLVRGARRIVVFWETERRDTHMEGA
ncbi:ABC transporter permease [Chelatococcus reniformis]|uniref:ABC transporter permease n=2 Tax=Chelatococcus reniformis TaxID=1494448 RepID=A0A916U0E4_9HYPH|nr:ABC transporter permease [Chelatococcus reniformis]